MGWVGAGWGKDQALSTTLNSGWAWVRGGGTAVTQKLVPGTKSTQHPGLRHFQDRLSLSWGRSVSPGKLDLLILS